VKACSAPGEEGRLLLEPLGEGGAEVLELLRGAHVTARPATPQQYEEQRTNGVLDPDPVGSVIIRLHGCESVIKWFTGSGSKIINLYGSDTLLVNLSRYLQVEHGKNMERKGTAHLLPLYENIWHLNELEGALPVLQGLKKR